MLSSAQLVTIDWADCPIDDGIQRLGDFLPSSGWLRTVSDGYGVSLAGHSHYRLAGTPPAAIDWAALGALVDEGIAAGTWPDHPGDPSAEPIWLFVLPNGDTPDPHPGAHTSVLTDRGLTVLAYVSYDPAALDLPGVEWVTSHEVIEALTDPFMPTRIAWMGGPLFGGFSDLNATEVADVCVGAVTEAGFTLCRSWSNVASVAGEAPCQPSPPGTWFGVQGPMGPIFASAPSSFDVPLLVVGEDPTVAFELTVSPTGLPGIDGTLDRTTVRVGDTVHLGITASSDISAFWLLRVDAILAGEWTSSWPVHVVPR